MRRYPCRSTHTNALVPAVNSGQDDQHLVQIHPRCNTGRNDRGFMGALPRVTAPCETRPAATRITSQYWSNWMALAFDSDPSASYLNFTSCHPPLPSHHPLHLSLSSLFWFPHQMSSYLYCTSWFLFSCHIPSDLNIFCLRSTSLPPLIRLSSASHPPPSLLAWITIAQVSCNCHQISSDVIRFHPCESASVIPPRSNLSDPSDLSDPCDANSG